MTNDEIAHVLRHGEIDIVGRINESSNQALYVEVTLDGVTIPACYKTEVGERPLWDFPGGLWRREVAAYELSEIMGMGLVPVTVARIDGPYAPGSLQRWVDDTTGDHYFTLRDRANLESWFRKLVIFDIVANNTDRKSGHVIFDGEQCWAIDQGLCFNVDARLRTVIWDFAGETCDATEHRSLRRLLESDTSILSPLISSEEVTALRERARFLLENSVFPSPEEDGEWLPYPWPLI